MFISYIIYKNKLWISELNVNNKTINKLEENIVFLKQFYVSKYNS